jgi:hypothetical protein
MNNIKVTKQFKSFDDSFDDADAEIFEVKPVILGGSPTDLANKVILNRQQHIEAVRYWDKIIRELRKQ